MAEHGAIVLCGGRSTRMGRPKAWLPWQGRPLVVHVVELLHRVVAEVVVVSSAELKLPPLRATLVRDDQPAEGPLVGLAVGLEAMEAELAFATSTDVPFLSEAFVRAVLSHGGAAAPVVDGFVQTLAAAYPRSAAATARALLAAGKRRPLDLLEAAGYVALRAEDLPDLDSLRGVNTPEAYLEALAGQGRVGTASLEFVGRPRSLAGTASMDVPIGTLAEVLSRAPNDLALLQDGHVAEPFSISLDGRDLVFDTGIPIGPGERVIVLESGAGH